MTPSFAGKQIWAHNRLDNPAELVLAAMELGCSGVLVKAWDGAEYLSQIEGVKQAMNDLGISMMLGAWGYHYGANITGEVAAMVAALTKGQPDWFCMDVEQQIANGGVLMASKLVDAVFLSKFGYATIGYTSFGIPHLHTDFPYAVFNQKCKVFMPQLYWQDFGKMGITAKMTPQDALSQCLADIKNTWFAKPPAIAPVGQAYGSALPQDIQTFGQAVKAHGLPGFSFFDMDEATAGMLKVIKGL